MEIGFSPLTYDLWWETGSKECTYARPASCIMFGIAVPKRTKVAEFFEFLKQQGYVRVWVFGEAYRVDAPEMPSGDRIYIVPKTGVKHVESDAETPDGCSSAARR